MNKKTSAEKIIFVETTHRRELLQVSLHMLCRK